MLRIVGELLHPTAQLRRMRVANPFAPEKCPSLRELIGLSQSLVALWMDSYAREPASVTLDTEPPVEGDPRFSCREKRWLHE